MINKNNNFYSGVLGIKSEEFNPNPLKSKDANDCMVRALCKLLNKEWDDVFKDIFDVAFKLKRMYNSTLVAKTYLEQYGYVFKKFDYRYCTIGQFIYEHKNDKFLIGNKSHIACCINGTIYDKKSNIDNLDYFITDYASYIYVNKDTELDGYKLFDI